MTDDRIEPTRATRIGILGSCVSRDTLETMPRPEYPITTYVARSSLLSAGTDASPNLPAEFATSSNFQLLNVRRDIEGHQLRALVEAGEPDVLLWDLVDERHGIFEFSDGTIITRSVDVLGIADLQPSIERARHIAFGADEHFLRWSGAAGSFVDALDAFGWRDRVLVVCVPWAVLDVEGKPSPWSMGTNAHQANRAFARYYDRLRQLGLQFISVEDPVADPAHRWGLAPFHYTHEVYDQIHAAIRRFVAGRACGGPTAPAQVGERDHDR